MGIYNMPSNSKSLYIYIYKQTYLLYVVVQTPGCVQLFVTSWTAARQVSLSLIISWSLPEFMSVVSVMPPSHLILWHPLLLLPSIFPSIRDFSNEKEGMANHPSILAMRTSWTVEKDKKLLYIINNISCYNLLCILHIICMLNKIIIILVPTSMVTVNMTCDCICGISALNMVGHKREMLLSPTVYCAGFVKSWHIGWIP